MPRRHAFLCVEFVSKHLPRCHRFFPFFYPAVASEQMPRYRMLSFFYDIIKGFLGSEYHDERGFLVVSILLLANLFLGIYYNLSIWYKLTEKTKYGAYLSIFGAIITLSLNFTLIPVLGFVGCAWATLVCYFSMTVASYYLGKRHFSVPYQVKRIALYLVGMLCIYFCDGLLL